ncbi:MAG: hypothetical protein K9N34_04295 [Candidatus Marinimicrobia bacterium]|nr:hypothetical protein [Candidatus Neomarinimicrobiota bacterium]MCF7840271.1 hypothetical protein [Candidatus Neomarinimicrobiota bacterium]MCF7903106.1 hypothetical protein [Candidatus Neomarinimicrobiota bacterium]
MKTKFLITLPFLATALLFWQCEKISSNTDVSGTTQTCEGCHTDLAALNALAQVPVDDGHGEVPG